MLSNGCLCTVAQHNGIGSKNQFSRATQLNWCEIIIVTIYFPCHRSSRKGQQYSLLLDGGLAKWSPWRIWVIIDAPHPACRTRQLGRAWGVARYKLSSNKSGGLELGSPYTQQSRGRWCPWVWSLPCLFPSLEFPIMAKLGIQSFARTPSASGLISM